MAFGGLSFWRFEESVLFFCVGYCGMDLRCGRSEVMVLIGNHLLRRARPQLYTSLVSYVGSSSGQRAQPLVGWV